MSISFQLQNTRAIQDLINQIAKEMPDEVASTILEVAHVDIETFAKKEADIPVDTGRLRASIHTKYTRKPSIGAAARLPIPQTQERYTYTAEGEAFDGTLQTPAGKLTVIVGTNVEYAKKINREGGGGKNSRSQLPKGTGQGFMDKAALNGQQALKRELQTLAARIKKKFDRGGD